MADFYLDDDEAQCTIEKSNIENFAMKAFGLAKVPNNTFFFIALFAHFTVYFIYGQVEEALRAYDASSKDEALKENAIALSLSYILQFLVWLTSFQPKFVFTACLCYHSYKLVTPVTSLLVIKPEDEKNITKAVEEKTEKIEIDEDTTAM